MIRWSSISKQLGGLRTGKQVRERWFNHLDPTIVRASWLPAEDESLRASQKRHGNKWSKIALDLPGRNENAVRNRWHSIEFKKCQSTEELGSKNSQVVLENEYCSKVHDASSPCLSEDTMTTTEIGNISSNLLMVKSIAPSQSSDKIASLSTQFMFPDTSNDGSGSMSPEQSGSCTKKYQSSSTVDRTVMFSPHDLMLIRTANDFIVSQVIRSGCTQRQTDQHPFSPLLTALLTPRNKWRQEFVSDDSVDGTFPFPSMNGCDKCDFDYSEREFGARSLDEGRFSVSSDVGKADIFFDQEDSACGGDNGFACTLHESCDEDSAETASELIKSYMQSLPDEEAFIRLYAGKSARALSHSDQPCNFPCSFSPDLQELGTDHLVEFITRECERSGDNDGNVDSQEDKGLGVGSSPQICGNAEDTDLSMRIAMEGISSPVFCSGGDQDVVVEAFNVESDPWIDFLGSISDVFAPSICEESNHTMADVVSTVKKSNSDSEGDFVEKCWCCLPTQTDPNCVGSKQVQDVESNLLNCKSKDSGRVCEVLKSDSLIEGVSGYGAFRDDSETHVLKSDSTTEPACDPPLAYDGAMLGMTSRVVGDRDAHLMSLADSLSDGDDCADWERELWW